MMRVMRWPSKSSVSKTFQINLILDRLEGFSFHKGEARNTKLVVDVKWRGPKRALGSPFKRSLKTQRSEEQTVMEDGSASFNQTLENLCVLAVSKKGKFQPWNVCFVVRKVVSASHKAKLSVVGRATYDLAEFAPSSGEAEHRAELRTLLKSNSTAEMFLYASFNFVELRTAANGSESVHRTVAPSITSLKETLPFEEPERKEKDQNSTKGSETMSSGDEFTSDEKLSSTSEESSPDRMESFESDLVPTSNEDDFEEQITIPRSCSYGKIAFANLHVEGKFAYLFEEDKEDRSASDAISLFHRTYSLRLPKMSEKTSSSESDQEPSQSSLRSLLSWRKRKLSFRSPRAKGEPLLNKAYGEEGGDEIDWDRRQAGSYLEPLAVMRRVIVESGPDPLDIRSLDFGESFKVGSWEHKEIVSRDEQLKLSTDIFFASIDQRSESAAGASACTVLVAVIADWMHRNPKVVPNTAEFNALIRNGSGEWRKLCEDEAYKNRFPDHHFDLETVIQAAVRPLSVIPKQSFVGFFQPEGLDGILDGAMSFDSIWDEIERVGCAVYIVSWNDHFFVLKVTENSCFLIDTLGERLYEGCNQAYVLRFDDDTSLTHCSDVKQDAANAAANVSSKQRNMQTAASISSISKDEVIEQKHVVYKGRDACREFVKGFLAAIPVRELQKDVKRGLTGETCLYRMLQIEFHYTDIKF